MDINRAVVPGSRPLWLDGNSFGVEAIDPRAKVLPYSYSDHLAEHLAEFYGRP